MRIDSKSLLLWLLAVVLTVASSAVAFVHPQLFTTNSLKTRSGGGGGIRPWYVSLSDPPLSKPVGGNKKEDEQQQQQTTWNCDDEANCVEVAACDEEECRTSLDVRIHGQWYDLAGWRKAHPAGAHWIDWYDGRDATEVMDAFHSEKGRSMYQRLPKSKEPTATMLEALAPADTPLQINFRKFRAELEQEGWWKRDIVHDVKLIGIWASLVLAAAFTTTSLPAVSIMALSLSFTAAGWLGHDYSHGVDPFSFRLRNFAAVAAGLLPTWWVDKHNKHHALSKFSNPREAVMASCIIILWRCVCVCVCVCEILLLLLFLQQQKTE